MCFSMPATPSKHVRVSFRNVEDVSRLSDPACAPSDGSHGYGSVRQPLLQQCTLLECNLVQTMSVQTLPRSAVSNGYSEAADKPTRDATYASR